MSRSSRQGDLGKGWDAALGALCAQTRLWADGEADVCESCGARAVAREHASDLGLLPGGRAADRPSERHQRRWAGQTIGAEEHREAHVGERVAELDAECERAVRRRARVRHDGGERARKVGEREVGFPDREDQEDRAEVDADSPRGPGSRTTIFLRVLCGSLATALSVAVPPLPDRNERGDPYGTTLHATGAGRPGQTVRQRRGGHQCKGTGRYIKQKRKHKNVHEANFEREAASQTADTPFSALCGAPRLQRQARASSVTAAEDERPLPAPAPPLR